MTDDKQQSAARLCNELREAYMTRQDAESRRSYEDARAWFKAKYKCEWTAIHGIRKTMGAAR